MLYSNKIGSELWLLLLLFSPITLVYRSHVPDISAENMFLNINLLLKCAVSDAASGGGAGAVAAAKVASPPASMVQDTEAVVFAALYERKIAILFTFPKADLSNRDLLDAAVCEHLAKALFGPAADGGLDADNLFGPGADGPPALRSAMMKDQLSHAGVTMDALGPADIKAALLSRGGVPDAVRFYISK